MMRIAVPSREGLVDEHFGHCKEFRVYGVGEGGALVEERVLPSPEGCGCKSGIAVDLARAGVTHLVGGNLGDGAMRVLGARGIQVIRGASGPARAAAEAFVQGRLVDSGQGCASHAHGEDCQHGAGETQGAEPLRVGNLRPLAVQTHGHTHDHSHAHGEGCNHHHAEGEVCTCHHDHAPGGSPQ